MFDVLLYLIILICGFPAGIILSKMCKDEIVHWRGRLIKISIICVILAGVVFFISNEIFSYKTPAIIALFFIIITNIVIVWKSHRKHKSK